MNESLPEKTRIILAAPFRWAAGLAMEQMNINPSGRYESHRVQLRRHLKTIPTHHSEHHLLRRFISDIPRSLARPSVEHNRVRELDTFTLQANGHRDNIQLITAALLGKDNELDSEAIIKMASEVEQVHTDDAGKVYRDAANKNMAFARIEENGDEEDIASKIKELVVPTLIPGVVIGFSGLGVSKLGDAQGSRLEITFYSVPIEN
jgi:hypothetical protein